MIQKPLDPNLLNIDLLIPEPTTFKTNHLGEVVSTSIFEPSSNVFDLKGLFSPEIFGEIGSDVRLNKPGYVDFKIPVFHPLVYLTICDLGDKYEKIMSGSLYAKFDKELKDFIPVEEESDGDTGYEFFCKHVDDLVYPETNSHKRQFKIALVEKYGKRSGMLTTWLVLPAGLRDYEVDEKGVPSEDEVNSLYRKLINISNSMKFVDFKNDIELFDVIRFRLQRLLVDIYNHFKTLIDGKNKFIQSKWAARGLNYGTRNVITAINSYVKDLDDKNSTGFNMCVVGIFQYLKSLGNLVPNRVLTLFMSQIGSMDSENVQLFNPETLKFELAQASAKMKKDWTTVEGINSNVNKLLQDDIKDSPVVVDKKYIALIQERVIDGVIHVKVIFNNDDIDHPDYVDENGTMTAKGRDLLRNTIKVFQNGGIDHSPIRPITYVELFYIAVAGLEDKFPALVTRYPITGAGSIYPAWPKLMSTIVGKEVQVHIGHEEFKVNAYPTIGKDYYRSLTVHYSHLGALGADHDGDVLSYALLFTDESVDEVKKLLSSKEYYLDPSSSLNYSVSNHVIDSLLLSLTE